MVVARRTLDASLSRSWPGEMAIRPKAEAAWAASGEGYMGVRYIVMSSLSSEEEWTESGSRR